MFCYLRCSFKVLDYSFGFASLACRLRNRNQLWVQDNQAGFISQSFETDQCHSILHSLINLRPSNNLSQIPLRYCFQTRCVGPHDGSRCVWRGNLWCGCKAFISSSWGNLWLHVQFVYGCRDLEVCGEKIFVEMTLQKKQEATSQTQQTQIGRRNSTELLRQHLTTMHCYPRDVPTSRVTLTAPPLPKPHTETWTPSPLQL